tara:strand:+ start:999 stop:1691 length:693 start_codon:yes stop_codon:yes gene_type:complete
MKPICIIPARAGSKGVKGKNIRKLDGKPLISYAIESTLESKLFSDVFVSTEDLKISKIAKKYGAEVPFLRPKKLAMDNSDIVETLHHTIKKLEQDYNFNSVMLRDCTCPFIDYNDMKNMINLFKKNYCDSVYSGVLAHPNPYFGMGELNSQQYLFTPKKTKRSIFRRQDAPKIYNLDGLVLFNSKQFMKTKKLLTNKSKVVEITKEHGHMIDFEFDFTVAELLVKTKSIA